MNIIGQEIILWQIAHLMSHFTSFSGVGMIRSGPVSLMLLVRICCPKLNTSVSCHDVDGCSVKEGWKWFSMGQTITRAALHAVLITAVWATEREFQRISNPVCEECHAILGTKLSNFIKCTSSLMYCQLHKFLSLPLQRWKTHLIQFDKRTGSWFEKCSSHHSRDTHNTHGETHNTLFASLVYGLPAAPPLPINFIGS